MTLDKEIVFVYGTLKKGFSNHRFLDGFNFKSAIAPDIELHSGPGFPYAKRGFGTTKGEIYEVSYDTLRRLDQLEGVPFHYNRELTPTFVGNEKIYSWIYLSRNFADHYPIIESGEWK